MRKFLKRLFCRHVYIKTITDSTLADLLIIKTLIKCENCDKSFAQHPSASCCYVAHIQYEIMREHFIKEYNGFKQP